MPTILRRFFTPARTWGYLSIAALTAALLVVMPVHMGPLAAQELYSEPSLEQALFNHTNRERLTRGLPPLAFHPILRDVARIRSWDMGNRGYFSHYTVEGLSAFDILDGLGFRGGGQGENIGYNYEDSSTSASSASRMFMASPPHAAQIVSGRYRYLGIGQVSSPRGAKYYTVLFST